MNAAAVILTLIPLLDPVFIGGLLVGAGLTAAAGLVAYRRSLARARRAEQRATSAERLAELGAMTSGLTHEIRNPLSTLRLNAQMLVESAEEADLTDDDRARVLQRARTLYRETDRLESILEDFLRYAGELRLSPTPTDLNTVVDELVDFFHPQAERNGVRLRAEPAAGPVVANADAQQLKQAVLNLLLNALQAIQRERDRADAGGDGGRSTPAEIILRTEHHGSGRERSAVLHVIDTGPGMDEPTRARVFQPYFSTRSGGTGLGLPTTRRIIEAHGGLMHLYSEPGRGTDFRIELPAAETGDTGRAVQAASPTGAPGRRAST